jgi:hypothetical protein
VHLVFFIGGVTFTEIAAIRWLSQQDGAHSRPDACVRVRWRVN